jgi:hypothetical protein
MAARVLGLLYFLFLLSFPSNQGFAQEAAIDARLLRACAAKANSLERLSCFDDLAKKAGPPVEVTRKSVGEWITQTDTSKFDDTKSVYVSLKAKQSITGWPGKSYLPELTIRCREKKTEFYIDFGMSPVVESGLYDGSTLQFRIDKQPPFKVVASKSTDGNALFLREPIVFAKRLYKTDQLLVRFIPFNSPAQETAFNVAGLEGVIVPLSEACKWPK